MEHPQGPPLDVDEAEPIRSEIERLGEMLGYALEHSYAGAGEVLARGMARGVEQAEKE